MATTPGTRRRPGRAWVLAAALVVASCQSGPTPSSAADHGSTASPAPALGLTWVTAPQVDRPELAFALPSAIPASSGEGRSGHPGHFPGQSVIDDAVTFGPGLLAIGYTYPGWTATGWTSVDGRTWQLSTISREDGTFPVAVAAGHGIVVAAGRHGRAAVVWTTVDGTHWEEHRISPMGTDNERMTAVVATADGFVAGGSAGPELGMRTARIWRSTDGRTWRPLPAGAAFADAEIRDLVVTGSGLVAVGVTGAATRPTGSTSWISPDGERWTRIDSPALGTGRAVALAELPDGGVVAVGSDPDEHEAMAWVSPDGRTWRQAPREASRSLGNRKIRMTDVTVVGDLVVGVGNVVGLQFGTAASWVSRDGLQWTRSTDTPAMEQGELNAVIVGGPGLVAVGTFGAPDNYIPRVWLSPGPP